MASAIFPSQTPSAPLRRQIFVLFQEALAGLPKPQRMARSPKAVSERLLSLTERTSPVSVRSMKSYLFQLLGWRRHTTFYRWLRRQAGQQRHPEMGMVLCVVARVWVRVRTIILYLRGADTEAGIRSFLLKLVQPQRSDQHTFNHPAARNMLLRHLNYIAL
jgi:hypothetical protein